jgi:methylase of polypeptide subunit release factors
VNRIALIVDAERPLAKEELARYRALHSAAARGSPWLTCAESASSTGAVFRVDARVLVPRPDTEVLVEVALARTASSSLGCRVLDLCTGSGCVAITIARERPTNRVWATDLSEGALAVARENALRLGAPQLAFFHGDLFAGLPEDARFELITANPPYIREDELPTLSVDVRAFEPTLALVSGADGLDLMRRRGRRGHDRLRRRAHPDRRWRGLRRRQQRSWRRLQLGLHQRRAGFLVPDAGAGLCLDRRVRRWRHQRTRDLRRRRHHGRRRLLRRLRGRARLAVHPAERALHRRHVRRRDPRGRGGV